MIRLRRTLCQLCLLRPALVSEGPESGQPLGTALLVCQLGFEQCCPKWLLLLAWLTLCLPPDRRSGKTDKSKLMLKIWPIEIQKRSLQQHMDFSAKERAMRVEDAKISLAFSGYQSVHHL